MKRTVSILLALVMAFALVAMTGCNSAYRYRGVTTAPVRENLNRSAATRNRHPGYNHRGRTNMDNAYRNNRAGLITPDAASRVNPGVVPQDGYGRSMATATATEKTPEAKKPESTTEESKRTNTPNPAPAPKAEKPAPQAS